MVCHRSTASQENITRPRRTPHQLKGQQYDSDAIGFPHCITDFRAWSHLPSVHWPPPGSGVPSLSSSHARLSSGKWQAASAVDATAAGVASGHQYAYEVLVGACMCGVTMVLWDLCQARIHIRIQKKRIRNEEP